jgi:hypothetical protein
MGAAVAEVRVAASNARASFRCIARVNSADACSSGLQAVRITAAAARSWALGVPAAPSSRLQSPKSPYATSST